MHPLRNALSQYTIFYLSAALIPQSGRLNELSGNSLPHSRQYIINSSIFELKSNKLKKDLEGIIQKVLTDSLRSMEEDGIITRTVYPEVPPRVEYALSDLGQTLKPILDSMVEWGNAYKKSNPKGRESI